MQGHPHFSTCERSNLMPYRLYIPSVGNVYIRDIFLTSEKNEILISFGRLVGLS